MTMLLTFSHSGFMLVGEASKPLKTADTAPVSQRYFYAQIPGVSLLYVREGGEYNTRKGNKPACLFSGFEPPAFKGSSKAFCLWPFNAKNRAFEMTVLILPNFKTTSIIIAEKFGKAHKNVLRAINNLEIPNDFKRLNFEPDTYIDQNGDEQKQINLTRDGFSLLVMGFTGKQAMEWKIKFLEAFNAMERELTEKPVLVKEHRRRKPAKRTACTPEQFAASIPQEDLLLTAQGHLSDAAKRNSDQSIQLAHACLARFKDHMDQPLSLTALYRSNMQESRSTPMKRSA